MLAIGFRVVGGLCALCVNFAWIHVFVGLATILGGAGAAASNSQANLAGGVATSAFGGIFVFAGMFVILLGYAMGYYGFRGAKALESCRDWNLCFGTSIAFLLFQPLGLALGIFAIIVLNRTTVRTAFGKPVS